MFETQAAQAAQVAAAAQALGEQTAKAFEAGYNSVSIKTVPGFLADAFHQLDQLKGRARDTAAGALVQYAASLEKNKQLPIGATQKVIQGLESNYASLTPYLEAHGKANADVVAKTMKFDAATTNLINTENDIRTKFGLWKTDRTITGGTAVDAFKSEMGQLQLIAADTTGKAHDAALAAMEKLRTGMGQSLGTLLKDVQAKQSAMSASIIGGSATSATQAQTNYAKYVATVQGAMKAGATTTAGGMKLILDATNATLVAFGGAKISVAGLNPQQALAAITGYTNYYFGTSNVGVNAPGSGQATPGHRAVGGMVDMPMVMVGEEAPQHPEVVIATNPAYRQRNLGLFAQAGQMLGIPGFAAGGMVAPGRVTAPVVTGQGVITNTARAALNKAAEQANIWLGGKMSTIGALSGGPPSAGVPGSVNSWLAQAMALAGVPATWLGMLQRQVMRESNGNPHAINLWDSNARAGHPSKGLLQTIDSTFNAYAIAGHGDIWNPVDNATAAIRYMIAAYGGGDPARALQVMIARGGGGYRRGGIIGFATGGINRAASTERNLFQRGFAALTGGGATAGAGGAAAAGGGLPTIAGVTGEQPPKPVPQGLSIGKLTGTISGLRTSISALEHSYSTIDSFYNLENLSYVNPDGTVNTDAVNKRLGELDGLIRIRQQIFQDWGQVVGYTQELIEAYRWQIARWQAAVKLYQRFLDGYRKALKAISTKGLKGNALKSAQDHQKTYQKLITEFQGHLTDTQTKVTNYQGLLSSAQGDLISGGDSRDSAFIDLLRLQGERTSVAGTQPTTQAPSPPPPGPGTTDITGLLQTIATQAQQAYAVSQAQYKTLQAFPPFAGSYATGGVVPGPAGAPRTIIAHGGERVGPANVQVTVNLPDSLAWLRDQMQIEIKQAGRRDSRIAARQLPGGR
jgi:SLT domain-containing protein